MSTTTSTDRIEKFVTLNAPRAKVWRAIADADQFGSWFGAKLDGPFTKGAIVTGHITSPGYEHVKIAVEIDRIEPEHYFSYRWHPYAIEPAVDYAPEPTTLVEFTLGEADGRTVLTIVESGFDRLPQERRIKAFQMNDGGWAEQIDNIERHVSKP